jgi:hypothetical protein
MTLDLGLNERLDLTFAPEQETGADSREAMSAAVRGHFEGELADPLAVEQGRVHAGTRSSSMAWYFN